MSGTALKSKPRILDLFCGAGGASMGYSRAGFDVMGVDIAPQPHYPFAFKQEEALKVLEAGIYTGSLQVMFDAIHASPPCQRYSDLAKRNGNADSHPDLIGPVRELLELTNLPYVIENVEGAPLRNPTKVCGTAIGLGAAVGDTWYRLRRHRLFEANWPIYGASCICRGALAPVIDVSGGGPTRAPRRDGAGGRTYKGTAAEARKAMGIDWMTKAELNEAIPPDYTELIGGYLLDRLREAVAA